MYLKHLMMKHKEKKLDENLSNQNLPELNTVEDAFNYLTQDCETPLVEILTEKGKVTVNNPEDMLKILNGKDEIEENK